MQTVNRCPGQLSPSDERSPEISEVPQVAAPHAAAGTILSTMSHYPGMRTIINEFVEGLPDEISKMRDFLERDDLPSLQRAAHQLRGTGGGYGFDAITEMSGQVEDAINAADKRESIERKINLLFDVIRRSEGFDESRGMTPAIQGVP